MSRVFATISQVMPRTCKNSNGGIGPCPSAPAAVKQKFHQLAVAKAHGNAAATVSATLRASLEACAVAAAAGAAGAASGGETNPRTQAPPVALEKAFQRSIVEKADGVCATLVFAELSIVGPARFKLSNFH